MSFIEYQMKQSFVSSGYKLFDVKRCVAQTAFESFTEESINPRFITLVQQQYNAFKVKLVLDFHSCIINRPTANKV